MKVNFSLVLRSSASCLLILAIAAAALQAIAMKPPDSPPGVTRPNYLKSLQHGLHWSRFPLHVCFTNSNNTTSKQEARVLLGFALWVKATQGKADYRVTRSPGHVEITVTYELSERPADFGEMGTTYFAYNPATHSMSKAEIHLKIWHDMSEEDLRQLQLTAAHEFGHALGINGHSPNAHDLMYPFTTPDSRVTDQDVNTLNAIYQGFPSKRSRIETKGRRKEAV